MFRISSLIFIFLVGHCMTAIAADDIDSKYFSRNVRYVMLKDKVALVERDRPDMATIDEWAQLVFLSADGEHKVSELIAALGSHYQGGAPKGLAEQTRALVNDLRGRGYLTLHDQKRKLPYYFAVPVEQQDKERARALMEADGFLKATPK